MKHALRWLSLVACALSLCGVQAAAQRAAGGGPVSLVPQGAVAVVRLDWRGVSRDQQLRRIINGDQFERLLRRSELSPDEVAEAAIFGDLKPSSSAITGMILGGRFNLRELVGRLKERGWAEHSYHARPIYSDPAGDSYLAPLRAGMLVAGTKSGVESVIEVEANPRTALAGKQPFRMMFAGLGASRQPISFVMALPQMYQDMADAAFKVATVMMNVAGLGPLGLILDKIGLARSLGFAISREGDSFPVQILSLMKDDGAAGFVSGALNLLKSLPMMVSGGGASRGDSEAIAMLQNMSVTRKGALLSIRFAMPKSGMPR